MLVCRLCASVDIEYNSYIRRYVCPYCGPSTAVSQATYDLLQPHLKQNEANRDIAFQFTQEVQRARMQKQIAKNSQTPPSPSIVTG